VGVIAVVPNDAAALEPVLKKARAAGIIVLTHESPDQENADWDIETIDNKAFGEKNFQTLGALMGGSGQFALYVGGLDVTLHNYWADVGLDYARKQWGSAMQLMTNISTDRTPCGEDADLCAAATGKLLEDFPDLKGIVAFGSQGPIGAGRKLRDLGRTDVKVVGAAIPSQAADLLKGGYIQHAYLWDPHDAGYALVAVGQRLLQGQTDLRQNAGFPGLGMATIDPEGRDVVFDKILDITADNADSFGF
jgi:simple sugar transport system substrate-binding protein